MFRKIVIILVVSVSVLLAGWYGCRRFQQYMFPYGWSHCCDIGLFSALEAYANDHDGKFPAGESCPEASLSLLYKDGRHADAQLLRGKSVPESVVREILESGRLLGPESCGWHYVEGLTLADDSRLAIFWDKAGLGHNGMRMSSGGHIVYFLSWFPEHITSDKWPEFLEEQKRLHDARSKRAIEAIPWLTAKIRLPSGEMVNEYEGEFELDFFPGSCISGTILRPSDLRWWKPPYGHDKVTLTLTLGDCKPESVEVDLSKDSDHPRSVIFEMEHNRN